MPKYRVHLRTAGFTSVVVEADDPDRAIDKAFERDLPGICAQCTGWGRGYTLEFGDEWEPCGETDEAVELVEGDDR